MKTDAPTDELPMRGASCARICQRLYSLFYLLNNVKLHVYQSAFHLLSEFEKENITTPINSHGSHAIAAQ